MEDEVKHFSSKEVTELTTNFDLNPEVLDRREDSDPFYVISAKHVLGRVHMKNLIQPAVYRAPEGFLQLPLGTPVDDKDQFVRMVTLLERPPLPQPELRSNSGPRALVFFFNEDGSAKGEAPNETVGPCVVSGTSWTDHDA